MSRFSGKRLLVLGSNVGAADIVNYAKENGAWTAVADWYPKEKSIPKQLADEALLISTDDVDALCAYVRENRIDAIAAGISEFNLLKAMEISKRCGLHFYCNRDQWDTINVKDRFRRKCAQHKVPCPKTYYSGLASQTDLSKVCYPAVLKPVDASASAGVHICENANELKRFLGDATQASSAGRIIIEEHVSGDEFTAHYVLHKGRAKLVCMDNRYPVAVHKGKVTTVPAARIFPCLFLDEYLAQVDPHMLDLCENLGMDCGVLFIQGLYDEASCRFAIFEAGLRIAGEAPYRFFPDDKKINFMHLMVDDALGVQSQYDLDANDPSLDGKCCGVVSFVAKGGKVGSIVGLKDAVEATPSVIDYESRYPAGSTVPDGDTLHQLAIRFVMGCESRQQMAKDIAYLDEHVEMFDDAGNSMVIKMDPERVFKTS